MPDVIPTPADVAEAEWLAEKYGDEDSTGPCVHGSRFIETVAALLSRARAAEERAKRMEKSLRWFRDMAHRDINDFSTYSLWVREIDAALATGGGEAKA